MTEPMVRAVHRALREQLAGPMVAYDLSLHPDRVHLGVPSSTATLIIAFDDPLDVGWLDEARLGTSQRLWVTTAGLHLRPALIRTHGIQRGIQLALTPMGCRQLFGVPLAEIADQSVSSGELPRGLTAGEHAQIAEESSWTQRFRLLERLLLSRLRSFSIAPELRESWSLLHHGHTVAETAELVEWSRRRLSTRFTAEFGVSPKQLGRLARFTTARAAVGAGRPLAEVAYACGFSDQAHLSREWRELAGQSPSRSEDFPFLQDLQATAT